MENERVITQLIQIDDRTRALETSMAVMGEKVGQVADSVNEFISYQRERDKTLADQVADNDRRISIIEHTDHYASCPLKVDISRLNDDLSRRRSRAGVVFAETVKFLIASIVGAGGIVLALAKHWVILGGK
jgi:hypothetical protein